MMTLDRLLQNKKIVNIYEGRPDGSILIRLCDRTEIIIFDGVIRDDDDTAILIRKMEAGE